MPEKKQVKLVDRWGQDSGIRFESDKSSVKPKKTSKSKTFDQVIKGK